MVALCCFLPVPGWALDLFVDQSSGDDTYDGLSWASARQTITSAIASAEGSLGPDVISVAAGRYQEQLVVPTETTLLGGFPQGGGARDPSSNSTVIDRAGESAPVVHFPPGSDGTLLDGFVITGGWSDFQQGGGILVEDAAPLIRGNVIERNNACHGSGLALIYTTARPAARIEGNLIRNNTSWCILRIVTTGGGVYILSPRDADLGTVLTGNRISGNEALEAGGLYFRGQGRMEHSIVEGNSSGVMLVGAIGLFNVLVSRNNATGIAMLCGENYRIDNVTVTQNGHYGIVASGSRPATGLHVGHSILWGHEEEISWDCLDTTPVVEYSLVEGGFPGGTNIINEDPLFAAGPEGDFYLSHVAAGQIATSPSVDAGSMTSTVAGLDSRTTRTDSVGDAALVDLGFHNEAIASLSVLRGTAADGLAPHRFVATLPFSDDPGSLTDPSLPRLFYRVPEAWNQIIVRKDLAGERVRLEFLASE